MTDQETLSIGTSARYISFGGESSRMPALTSPKGYELLLPPGQKALCCNIAVYGSYLSTEETELIDYYVRIK
ncbi:MAG: hypothetical protein J6B43_04235 [Lachnospiraceae bacterium]|nr:hypothetical protein [Lachnospiraceae bacterium]